MGVDGDELLDILDLVEKRGKHKFTKLLFNKMAKEYPNVCEYDMSIKAALMNLIPGVAQGLVKHGTEGGLDAWRKLYHKYMPLADDLQNILIRQFMSVRPVREHYMDRLFDELERIRELYIKVDSDEAPTSEICC